jgi:transaldolase
MTTNPLLKIHEFGQSIWLDFISRGMLTSGQFQALIDDDGILGVTSNPSIFEKAITGSQDYDDAIRKSALKGKTAKDIYECLVIADIIKAADLFQETFEKTGGKDGFVSLEVSPHLAYDTEGTITEARMLWNKVSRPNLLIKVPGTAQGLPAIKQLISEGINVNVTLLFGLDRYCEVVEAYMSGLETRALDGKPIDEITSVASFFLSRIDLKIDPLLAQPSSLRGQTAIASAKLAYQKYKFYFETERFKNFRKLGAQSQRLLWASTSTKNATDSDVKYVEALIGPDTVNTIPLETLIAYRNHGKPAQRLDTEISEAESLFEKLSESKIDITNVTTQLESEGVKKFSTAFDKLMASLEEKRKRIVSDANKAQPAASGNL